MDELNQSSPPSPSLKRLGGAAAGLLLSHLELLGIELQEEKSRLFQVFLLCGLSLVFVLLVMIALSALVLIHFWDSHRMAAAIGICLFYLVALGISVLRIIQLGKQGESPFSATMQELARNKERLLP